MVIFKFNSRVRVQLERRVKSRRLAQLRSALAGEGEASESVIIRLLKTLLTNKFGVFETKR